MSCNDSLTNDWLRSDCAALYQELASATRVTKRARLLRLALTQCRRRRHHGNCDLYLEFGVHEGKDLARMASYLATLDKSAIFHGFDSFQGLPEDWDNGQLDPATGQLLHQQGAFSVDGQCPQLDQVPLDLGKRNPAASGNIELHTGWFHATVAPFLDQQLAAAAADSNSVAFVHADADLYSYHYLFKGLV